MEWTEEELQRGQKRLAELNTSVELKPYKIAALFTLGVELYLSRSPGLVADDEALVRSVLIATEAGAVVKNVEADHAALSRLAALAREAESLRAQLATERAGDLQLRQDLGAAPEETLRGAAMRILRSRDTLAEDLAAARSHVCPARWDLIP
jgi:hypothetical protein